MKTVYGQRWQLWDKDDCLISNEGTTYFTTLRALNADNRRRRELPEYDWRKPPYLKDYGVPLLVEIEDEHFELIQKANVNGEAYYSKWHPEMQTIYKFG